ncbi:hypothetical protein [Bryocella elongata]|uniref:hypothetical protein n=1 Tax=Bryocella elongata TaxID=863522 RepID=UPI0011B0A2D5|nr:hypothetical protein [Bryocella elongata]
MKYPLEHWTLRAIDNQAGGAYVSYQVAYGDPRSDEGNPYGVLLMKRDGHWRIASRDTFY